jgi:hypothetical protein
MLKWIDLASGLTLLAIGALHVAAGAGVFAEPTARGVWFVSAGFLGIAAGLANLSRAAAQKPDWLQCLAALSGAAGILTMGALLTAAGAFRLPEMPGTLVLLAAVVSTAFALAASVRAVSRRPVN